jgi:chromate transporter
VIKLIKGVFKDFKALIIYIIAFVLSALWKVSPMLLILGAGAAGLVFYLDKIPAHKIDGGESGGGRE